MKRLLEKLMTLVSAIAKQWIRLAGAKLSAAITKIQSSYEESWMNSYATDRTSEETELCSEDHGKSHTYTHFLNQM